MPCVLLSRRGLNLHCTWCIEDSNHYVTIGSTTFRGVHMHMVLFIERGVALSRLAFQNHCELCDAVQRVHGNAGEAGHGPLASAPRKCRNAALVGSVRFRKRPEA